MIKIHNFGPFQGLPDPSPFCLKVDIWCRMNGLEFKSVPGANNLRTAPKGKLPYIEDNGRIIADSTFIIDYLKQSYGDRLDARLTNEQQAVAHAFIKMLEENLYWCILHSRWFGDKTWPVVKAELFGGMNAPMRELIGFMAQRGLKQQLQGQGIGRHSNEEIHTIAGKDLTALSEFLQDRHYFFNDSPTTLDAVAYAFLAEAIVPELDCPFVRLARSYDNLAAFCERIKTQYYDAC